MAICFFLGLLTAPMPATLTAPPLTGVALRPVRVLLLDRVAEITVRSSGKLTLRNASGSAATLSAHASQLTFRAGPSGLNVDDRPWPANDLTLESSDGLLVLVTSGSEVEGVSEATYAGSLRIIADGMLQVINEVELEDYVASVVAGEIWPSFEVEAYRAQAIVTRTYVLYHMLRRTGQVYDVSANQGSQVYRGIRNDAVGRSAAEAASYTRGLACAWNGNGVDRIFCTYYSAACGGMSQCAAPLGAEGDIPPLSGGVRCDWCRIAPGQTYRWGPVRIPLRQVDAKLCERFPEMALLGGIHGVLPGELTRFGRPLTYRLKGSRGETREILAERFRLAVGPNDIKSTDCHVAVEGGDVVFSNGRGFGHGLGLCQWGMQGQALEGRKAAEILLYYFPGSKLIRVY